MAAKASPAPAAAPVAAKEPTEAELVAENKALEAKIAALKAKLGISAAEEEDEKSRVRELFRTFDRDGNGWIDRDEFELLAFQCGSDLSVLTPETLAKTFAAVNPKGDGKLTFDDFYKWLKSGAAGDLKGGAKGANLQLLRLKLQSKAWAKRLDNKDAKGKPAAGAGAGAGAAAAAKGAAADAKAGAGAGGKVDAKAAPKVESKVSNFAFTLGKFGDAKSGVYFSTGENADAAAALRQAVNAPDNTPTFAFVDLNLKPGFDEGQIGELSGIIEALISAVPWQQIPLPIYSSHNVDIVDGEAPNSKALRVTLFSGVDLQDLAAGVMGQNGGQPLKDVGKGSMKLELPFGVADLKDPAFRFSAENLKFRLTSEGDIDRNVLAQSQEIVAQMSPQRAWVQGMRNATAQFMKGFDLTLNFAELSDLVAAVPDFDPQAAMAQAQAQQQQHAVARRGRRPPMPHPTPLQALKAGLAQAADMPVAMMLDQVLSQLPMLVQQTGQGALYDAVRNNVTGLGRVQVVTHDYTIKLGFKGLDFGLLLPPLN